MLSNSDSTSENREGATVPPELGASSPDIICPVCGATLISEKCKVVCRSERCRCRIVFNCAEF